MRFFLFYLFFSLWKGCDDLSFQSCVLLVSKTPQSSQAGRCSSGEDLKFQTVRSSCHAFVRGRKWVLVDVNLPL